MELTDTEFLVMQTVAMRLSEKEALEWLKSHDVSLKHAQFYRIKKRIKQAGEKWKEELQKQGYWPLNLLLNQQALTVLNFSWENARKEKDPAKNQKILESIAAIILPYFSTTHEVALLTARDEDIASKKNSEA